MAPRSARATFGECGVSTRQHATSPPPPPGRRQHPHDGRPPLADAEEGADEGSDGEGEAEVPTRVVASEVLVNVRARMLTLDFAGTADAHSIRTVLANIAPRHLVLAYGTLQARQALAAACSSRQDIQWQVHTAGAGESVDASSGSSSYRVALSDGLLQSLDFRSMGAYRLAWLSARIQEQQPGAVRFSRVCTASLDGKQDDRWHRLPARCRSCRSWCQQRRWASTLRRAASS